MRGSLDRELGPEIEFSGLGLTGNASPASGLSVDGSLLIVHPLTSRHNLQHILSSALRECRSSLT